MLALLYLILSFGVGCLLLRLFFPTLFFPALRSLQGQEVPLYRPFLVLPAGFCLGYILLGWVAYLSAWLGFARCQMPFEVEPRRQGRTKWRFSALLRLFVDSIIAYTAAPLLLVGVMGLVMLAAAAVLTVQTLWMYFSHQAQTGFSTVILLQLFIGSGLMLALSVIGLYIGKIYEEVKGRPRYLVQEDTDALLPVDPR